MVNPPKPGQPSYDLYNAEVSNIFDSLKRRANLLTAEFGAMTNVSCQPIEGALYAFPKVKLPAKAVDAAKAAGVEPDTFYCLKMLEKTGICGLLMGGGGL
jgi:aspartate/methionine/tyrosine aminotransferase